MVGLPTIKQTEESVLSQRDLDTVTAVLLNSWCLQAIHMEAC